MPIDLLQKRPAPPESTVELLLECHERIRRFTNLALKLVTAEGTDEQIADAARSLVSYFGRAFPLHAQDEDISLRPRLEAAGYSSPELRSLSGQHDDMHHVLDGLLLRWGMILDAPGLRGTLRDKLDTETRELARLIDAHLAMEEEKVFPFVREVLTLEQDREIVREMRARRASAP